MQPSGFNLIIYINNSRHVNAFFFDEDFVPRERFLNFLTARMFYPCEAGDNFEAEIAGWVTEREINS